MIFFRRPNVIYLSNLNGMCRRVCYQFTLTLLILLIEKHTELYGFAITQHGSLCGNWIFGRRIQNLILMRCQSIWWVDVPLCIMCAGWHCSCVLCAFVLYNFVDWHNTSERLCTSKLEKIQLDSEMESVREMLRALHRHHHHWTTFNFCIDNWIREWEG